MRRLHRWTMGPVLALAGAVLLLAAGVATAVYQNSLYTAQKTHEVTAQAQILAASVTAALDFNDTITAQEYVNALRANPEVRAAGVYNMDGIAVAAYVREGEPPLPKSVSAGGAMADGDSIIVTVPVVQNGALLGRVFVRSSTDTFERRLMRYGVIALLACMAALLFAVAGLSQAALSRANRALEMRAGELAAANEKLQAEMIERAKAEEALRQSQKMEAIGQLSGGIAHDFNNLLTVIKGNLQLLERRIAQGRTDVKRYVDSAAEALRRAATLTQRVLAFSRRQPLSPRPVHLSRLIEDMRELLRHSVGETVKLENRLAADWWTFCDANQLENVILNLVNNARDAMPRGGMLTIATENAYVDSREAEEKGISPGDYVRLSVHDTGVGMPEEVRSKAIDPFFTTKPHGQGTGLGLSMSFGYVRQSNGFMDIESAVGRGTIVRILMPRYAAESEALRA
ncbi:MAG: ATP-binding protein [Alphaproteobacteria bacterium]